MQRFYIVESQKALGNLNVRCCLSPESRLDLEWWVANLEKVNGKEFFPKIPDLEIYSDASMTGYLQRSYDAGTMDGRSDFNAH